jgi:hypothetical protein
MMAGELFQAMEGTFQGIIPNFRSILWYDLNTLLLEPAWQFNHFGRTPFATPILAFQLSLKSL